MVRVQNLLGVFQIVVVLGSLFPGQLQKRLDVGAQHVGLLASGRHPAKTLDLLAQLVLGLLVRLQKSQFFLVLVRVGHGTVLPKLLADHLHLFPQDILLLVLVNVRSYLFLEILLDAVNLYLGHQRPQDHLVARFQGVTLQHTLAHRVVPGQLNGDLIQQFFQAGDHLESRQHVLAELGVHLSVLIQFILHNPQHGLLGQAVQILIFLIHGANLGDQRRLLAVKAEKFSPLHPFHQHPYHMLG